MRKMMRKNQLMVVLLLVLTFVFSTMGIASAGEKRIKPKGDKKIMIGVLDLISAIEVAALWNESYAKQAKARGWDIRVFDLNLKFDQAQVIMENMITAGYDAIIVNWTSPKFYEEQCKKAFAVGIPIIGVAAGKLVPGFTADYAPMDLVRGAQTAQYLVGKMKKGGKVIVHAHNVLEANHQKYLGAIAVLDYFKVNYKEQPYSGGRDPGVAAYEDTKNLLLADSKKEIKGILSHYDGAGVPAAQACVDMGRLDIVNVTIDDSPKTYEAIRTLPTLYGTSGVNGLSNDVAAKIFNQFENIFAGNPWQDQQWHGIMPYLVTKENLPPKGYFLNPCGYKGRPQEFKVK
jgi:ABC-type sugar transport system substrate-binding protein